MNSIDHLSAEDKKTICGLITGKVFKEYFIKHDRDFSKMKGGFRARKISEEFALQTAINNTNRPFIVSFVNSSI